MRGWQTTRKEFHLYGFFDIIPKQRLENFKTVKQEKIEDESHQLMKSQEEKLKTENREDNKTHINVSDTKKSLLPSNIYQTDEIQPVLTKNQEIRTRSKIVKTMLTYQSPLQIVKPKKK